MPQNDYQKRLRSVAWQKKRALVIERDKWKCQNASCKTPEASLQVHHLEYITGIHPADYPMDMLITLCENCHDKERNREPLEKHLAATLRMKGFLMSDLLAMSCLVDTDIKFSETLLRTLRNFQNG